MHVPHGLRVAATGLLLAGATAACDDADRLIDPSSASSIQESSAGSGQFKFTPLATSAVCGPSTEQPFVLPVYRRGSVVNPVGADIWVATGGNGGEHQPATSTVRFASLPDCAAEPTGIYFDKRGWALLVHVQHRGGPDPRDLAVRIERVE